MVSPSAASVNLFTSNDDDAQQHTQSGFQQFGVSAMEAVLLMGNSEWEYGLDVQLLSQSETQETVLGYATSSISLLTVEIQNLVNLERSHYPLLYAFLSRANFELTNSENESFRFRYKYGVSEAETTEDLFEALLGMMRNDGPVLHRQRSWELATAAAVYLCTECSDACLQRVEQQLKSLRVTKYKPENTLKKLRQNPVEDSAHQNVNQTVNIKERFPECPIGESVMLPPGYHITSAGAIQRIRDGEIVSLKPIFISARLRQVEDDQQALGICYLDQQVWRERVISRRILADSNLIKELAGFGVTVTSNSASLLVGFLAALEAANDEHLAQGTTTQQLGWLGAVDTKVFLQGSNVIADPAEHCRTTVIYRGADAGDDQYARGFSLKGDMQIWWEAMRVLENNDRMRFLFYASLSAALLRILKVSSFTVDLAGNTTLGKTIALRVAASVWGNPNETQDSVLGTWNMTPVAIERRLASSHGLPVFLDDSQHCQDPELVKRVIYQTDSGRARGRGSKAGTAHTSTFETVLLSSGETQLTSFCTAGGQHTRVLSLWGSPFGANCEANARVAEQLDEACRQNFGHAGNIFVQALLSNRSGFPELQRLQTQFTEQFSSHAGNHKPLRRIAKLLACVNVTAWLAHHFNLFPFPYRDVITPLMPQFCGADQQHDVSLKAFRDTWEWILANQDRFCNGPQGLDHGQESYGRWDRPSGHTSSPHPRTDIGLYPKKLEEFLASKSYQPKAILQNWADNEWLVRAPGARHRGIATRIGSGTVHLITISPSVFEQHAVAEPMQNATDSDPLVPPGQR